ncbi:MAG: hypothetical protein ABI857_03420 [Acidobacteriota bacterium]
MNHPRIENSPRDLGRLVSVHGPSPYSLQKASIVAVLSFFFFMATLLVFYVRQQIFYFVLSTAFLVVYIFTLIGWVMQKRNVVSIYEHGITHRKFSSTWDEITSVNADSETGITLVREGGETLTISKTTADIGRITTLVKENLPS